MARAEYTQTITIKVTPKQKAFWEKQIPNPSKWLRELINSKMEEKNG